MKKLAFVAPWYGRNIPGGAETVTYQTATRLKQAGFDVEVLTTCIRDVRADWATNHHKPGLEMIDGVPVRRFRVKKRDKPAFDQVNWQLMQGQAVTAQEETIFNNEMIRCPDLYAYIRQRQDDYLFIFIPYMFATTYFGAQIIPRQSIVIPCLHDEAYARLQIHQQTLPQVRALLFLSPAESDLADRLYRREYGQIRAIIGAGVDTAWQGDGRRFRQKYGLDARPFLLYAGRREPGKNTPLLVDYWNSYVQTSGRDAKLVLIGSGEVIIPDGADDYILDLGFVPVQDKYDAYAAADILCMPSVHESFSIVIMESWLAGTPVLVHGHCAVTREHCAAANGGLYFTHLAEFAAAVDYLLDHRETAVTLGQQGRQYVLDNFHWDVIINKYQAILERALAS